MKTASLWLLGVIFLCSIWVQFWQPVVAMPTLPASELVVRQKVVITELQSPLRLSRLHILPEGELVIEAGVELLFTGGATVEIEGSLEAKGTEKKPIRFTGTFLEPWQGLVVKTGAPQLLVEYVEFTHFVGPIEFNNGQAFLSNLTLRDGVNNRLHFSSKVGNNLRTTLIRFSNQQRGSTMRTAGIEVEGSFSAISLERTSFEDNRVINESFLSLYRLIVQGSYLSANFSRTEFPQGCPVRIEKVEQGHYAEVAPNPVGCQEPSLPVVFVPGYGTSLNLEVLSAQLSDTPQLNGWRFLHGLTPAYTDFLAILEWKKIAYEVAYYDWRLPADEAVRLYLKPVIEKAKKKHGTNAVLLVGHSFGGILSRAYIQGESYSGDVQRLVELGTPNQGAAKAYGVWQAGELPKDWQALRHLLRFYQYRFGGLFFTPREAIQHFFPSARQLLPIYPALSSGQEYKNPELMHYRNDWLLRLRANTDRLKERVSTTVIAGTGQLTLEQILVAPPLPSVTRGDWLDGQPTPSQPPLEVVGDGTVPRQSVELQGFPFVGVTGKHNDLPSVAARQAIEALFPQESVTEIRTNLANVPTVSFLFDCPIDVTIYLPDGSLRLSTQQDVLRAGVLVPDTRFPGEVVVADDLLWMLLPRQEGNYRVVVTARATTPVRIWVDEGSIHSFVLNKGQQQVLRYNVVGDEAQLILPSSSPTPPLSLSASSEPDHSIQEAVSPPLQLSDASLSSPPSSLSPALERLAATFPQRTLKSQSETRLPTPSPSPLPKSRPRNEKRMGLLFLGVGALLALSATLLFLRSRHS